MKTKKKNILRLLIALAAVLAIVYVSLPYYARQGTPYRSSSSVMTASSSKATARGGTTP